jgi:hypothetical protein
MTEMTAIEGAELLIKELGYIIISWKDPPKIGSQTNSIWQHPTEYTFTCIEEVDLAEWQEFCKIVRKLCGRKIVSNACFNGLWDDEITKCRFFKYITD